MAALGDIEAHFWLTRSVARVIGLNLSEAIACGALDGESYGKMVTRCRQAGCAQQCAAWLAEQTDEVTDPPPFCVHADQFKVLRPA